MIKKLLFRSTIMQVISMIVSIFFVFIFCGIYTKQQTDKDIYDHLDSLAEIPVEEFFQTTSSRQRQKITVDSMVIVVYNNGRDESIRYSDESFCSSSIAYSIAETAEKKGEGVVRYEENCYAFRYSDYNELDFSCIIYVMDVTEKYSELNRSIIMLCLMSVFVATLVVLIFLFSNRKNQIPVENAFNKQKSLIADASHELKTPLTILTAQVSALKRTEEPMSEEQKEWVNGIEQQVQRMAHLVNEMLELSRFEMTHSTANHRIFNFSELTEKVILGSEVLAFEKELSIESHIDGGLYINADPDGMEKVIYALMENALKYTPKKEKILINLHAEKHKAVLKIKNTGVGVPRKEIPRMFDRFYRGDKAHTSSDNFGLGLPIVQSIVDANNGVIGVDSEEGKYTEFVVIMKSAEKNKRKIDYEKKNTHSS